MRKWLVENWRAIFTCSHWTFVFCIGDRRQQLHCQLQLEWSSSRTRRVFEYNAKGHSISAETSSSRRDGAVWHKKVNSADGTGMHSNGWVKPEAEPNQGHGNCIRNPKALIYMGILFSFFFPLKSCFHFHLRRLKKEGSKKEKESLGRITHRWVNQRIHLSKSLRGFNRGNHSEESLSHAGFSRRHPRQNNQRQTTSGENDWRSMNRIKEPPYRRNPRAAVNNIMVLIKRGELSLRRQGIVKESLLPPGPKRNADGKADGEVTAIRSQLKDLTSQKWPPEEKVWTWAVRGWHDKGSEGSSDISINQQCPQPHRLPPELFRTGHSGVWKHPSMFKSDCPAV